jgi:hypothetical protein
VKKFRFSHWLSTIVAISLSVGLTAAQTQEIQGSKARAAERSGPERDAGKATPDSTASAQPVKPQPLSEEESARLAARDQEPGPEVSGGALSNLHLTYIVIALAAAVLVLILK